MWFFIANSFYRDGIHQVYVSGDNKLHSRRQKAINKVVLVYALVQAPDSFRRIFRSRLMTQDSQLFKDLLHSLICSLEIIIPNLEVESGANSFWPKWRHINIMLFKAG